MSNIFLMYISVNYICYIIEICFVLVRLQRTVRLLK